MAVEVIHNPALTVFKIIAFGIGLTAIAFIALVLWLDRQPNSEPVKLPSKR